MDHTNGSSAAGASGTQPSLVMSNACTLSDHAGPPSGKPSASTSPRRSRFSPTARSLFARSGIGPELTVFPASGHSPTHPLRVSSAVEGDGVLDAPAHPERSAMRRSACRSLTTSLYRRLLRCRVSLSNAGLPTLARHAPRRNDRTRRDWGDCPRHRLRHGLPRLAPLLRGDHPST